MRMTMEELVIAIRVTAEDAEENLEAITEGLRQIGEAGGSGVSRVQKQMSSLMKEMKNTSALRQQVSSYRDLARQVKSTGGSWEDLSGEVRGFAKNLGVADGDLDGLIAGLGGLEGRLDTALAGGAEDLRGMIGELEAMRAQLLAIPQAEITADNTQALSAINVAIAAASALLALFGQTGIVSGTAKSGGGGGGGGSRRNAEAEAAQAAQQAQEDAYRAEVERIEHRRRLGQMTAREEIEELERVRREYAQTAEQIMDIDERIYEARKALRENEAEKITTLHDSMVTALENRYEEQRQIEQKRIADSISAWNAWSDETCAAIQRQIDALDEQAQAEDREKTQAEHLRKIAGLEQAMLYETDAYNRDQLSRQLEQAKEAYLQVQRDWAREDQRSALEAQMQAVQNQAQEEIDRLSGESERIDAVYDQMVSSASLAMEAQKLLMSGAQQDILSMLAQYAPDYEATGRSLGEKLYDGLVSALGDISAWFAQFDMQFEQMAARVQDAAFARTGQLQLSGMEKAQGTSPTIVQTVNFNQPVESPADVARRMQQVSEELAGMM